jgi:ABC-type Mn2+/Zn2+ transport system permease subunit
MFFSILIGLFSVWTGILLACVTNWPPSFWITAIIFTLYLAGEGFARYVFRLER